MTEHTGLTDIEIYIKYLAVEDISRWLATHFATISEMPTPKGAPKNAICFSVTNHAGLDQEPFMVMLLPKVVGIFTSVWFDSPDTPWQDDQDCARQAFNDLNQEIRCTAGTWQEDQDPDLWWSISDQGEKEIIWRQNK